MKSKNNEEKDSIVSWWALGLILLVITIIVLTFTSGFLVNLNVIFEREAFEQSHQYVQSLEDEIVGYEATIAELESQLRNPNLSDANRSNIDGQISAINIRLRAAQSKLNNR